LVINYTLMMDGEICISMRFIQQKLQFLPLRLFCVIQVPVRIFALVVSLVDGCQLIRRVYAHLNREVLFQLFLRLSFVTHGFHVVLNSFSVQVRTVAKPAIKIYQLVLCASFVELNIFILFYK